VIWARGPKAVQIPQGKKKALWAHSEKKILNQRATLANPSDSMRRSGDFNLELQKGSISNGEKSRLG